jgi:hypothetical protein
MDKVLNKIGNAIQTSWKWLEGKKRRIATVSGIVMAIAKPNTTVYAVAQYAAAIFGSADLTSAAIKILPEGIRKLKEKK